MPRKSISRSNPASTKGHKRQLSQDNPALISPATRASKRIKDFAENTPASVTPKKSKYFEAPDTEDEAELEDSASEGVEASGYEDEDASGTESSLSEADGEEDEASDEDTKKKPTKGRKSSATKSGGLVTTVMGAGRQLWREGVKTGLGPGKQVFIEKPKPRGDGGIKYVPARIHPNTMAFLADLRKNNDREWFKMHDPDYRQSWSDWQSYVDTLSEKISEVDDTIPELPAKDLVFRIYRDIRFSSDPTPYKPHFSAAWSRTGRKGPFACYYLQISPGGRSFVGSGLWMPEAQPLALLRANIDNNPKKIRRILTDAGIRKLIFGGILNDEKKAIKAFTAQNAENALKTRPKGYEADNPNIELLRLRNFTIGKKVTDEEISGPQGLSHIMELIGAMTPFVTYLNNVVMPDDEASSSDESNDDSTHTDN